MAKYEVSRDSLNVGGRRYKSGDQFEYDEKDRAHQNLARAGKINPVIGDRPADMEEALGGPVVTGDAEGNVKGISPAADSQDPEGEAEGKTAAAKKVKKDASK